MTGLACMRCPVRGWRVGKAGSGLMEVRGAVQVNAALGDKLSQRRRPLKAQAYDQDVRGGTCLRSGHATNVQNGCGTGKEKYPAW